MAVCEGGVERGWVFVFSLPSGVRVRGEPRSISSPFGFRCEAADVLRRTSGPSAVPLVALRVGGQLGEGERLRKGKFASWTRCCTPPNLFFNPLKSLLGFSDIGTWIAELIVELIIWDWKHQGRQK